ncbi:alanyl-tRNA editing protein [uncultured Turicimonas sp.]|uniref:alanyl-tRNA editing protein n=1 Tax=uncultured Turicimonas sp. TaxID=1918607 RepID=UPI002803F7CF|nr:alanyl-tRNA editing protein [uncultured Turicimonas sp.]
MEELNELFYRDPYCQEFEAEVLSCTVGKKGFDVVLSDTAFYPEGGGQPSDLGTLGDAKVLFVKRQNGQVVHQTDKELKVGEIVKGKIDWARRYDNMQNHSCEHIFSGLVNRKYGFNNVGFHMGEDVLTVDFDGYLTPEQLAEMEELTNAAFRKGQNIHIFFPSEEELKALDFRSKKELKGKVRIVEFPEADICACCGTHVKNTAEIGSFKILSSFKHRGGTRVEFAAGKRLINYINMLLRESASCVEQLSAKPQEISSALKQLYSEKNQLTEKLSKKSERIMNLISDSLPSEGKLLFVSEAELTPFEIKVFCNRLSEKKNFESILVLSEQAEKKLFNYILFSKEPNLVTLSRELNKELNGRGGGKPPFVQGSFAATEEIIKKAVEAKLG